MRESLAAWAAQADAFTQMEHFRVRQSSMDVTTVTSRVDDYYISLVGELFNRLREGHGVEDDWAVLGNALAQFASAEWGAITERAGISRPQAALFSASAFYCGGYPASAYLVVQSAPPTSEDRDSYVACYDLMARSRDVRSKLVRRLLAALRRGDIKAISDSSASLAAHAEASMAIGPEEWIGAYLLQRLVERFASANVRAVLPDGGSEVWTPLVQSFLNRRPPTWEFFPSQIQAIEAGLLSSDETFTLQMPTGAGKTTLAEALIYSHITDKPSDVAVLLVPYRSLASELRGTLVRRMNDMGIHARCAYGGTVPCGDEIHDIEEVQLLVATPESMSGILSAYPDLFGKIGLVICDEGHLLDTESRGVGLELLLARMKERTSGSPRFVFISAIVPNVEEINSWLGGSADSLVVSDYRPALAEFSKLSPVSGDRISLVMHPQESEPTKYSISDFLTQADFQWLNPATQRVNTYGFNTMKTQAVAAARKSLTMGATVLYAANKRGTSGAVGIAGELLRQLERPLPLPAPIQYAKQEPLAKVARYMESEYGADWTGTRCLRAGVVLHHGDVPQESREALERLLRSGAVQMAVCTSTLAEGVNLPIRTLVLYSVNRRTSTGVLVEALTRDIKNLVGRAGRPGSTTRGLVLCANPREWPLVEKVAVQASGEPVRGALRKLLGDLQSYLVRKKLELSNEILEGIPDLFALVDGIDATLVDLAVEEIGEEALLAAAEKVVQGTYAVRQVDEAKQGLLRSVFRLRAAKILDLARRGRLSCVRESGARARVADAVQVSLLPAVVDWSAFTDPIDVELVDVLFEWAWEHSELEWCVRDDLRLGDEHETPKAALRTLLSCWLEGERYRSIAEISGFGMDDALCLLAHSIGYVLHTELEQAIALLAKLLESEGRQLSSAVSQFPDHLRHGLPTQVAVLLASVGVKHRFAALEVGSAMDPEYVDDPLLASQAALSMLSEDPDEWTERLGTLVWDRTLEDLKSSPHGWT